MDRKTQHCTAPSLYALVGIIVLALSGPAFAQSATCEYPLFVKQTTTDANVLFVFDSSISMNTAVFHEDYDPRMVYTGLFKSSVDYYVRNDGFYEPRDFLYAGATSPSVYLVDSDQGRDGIYPGNYLNWLYYVASDAQRSLVPRVTRIQVAKATVSDVITTTTDVRFGIMKFNYDKGGTLVSPLGTSKATLLSDLNGIEGDSFTPLAETMVDVVDEFKRTGSGAPIQYWCQKNFVIVVTDGFPTRDLNVPGYIGDYDNDGNDPGTCSSMGSSDPNSFDCSDYLDDVAAYLHDVDLRSDLQDQQNAYTYAIGFALDAGILQDTADNGGGLYFNANNAAELQKSMASVLRDIVSKMSSGTAVSVVSSENQSGNRIYRAKFLPGLWQGFLEAFDLPYQTGDLPAWRAGEKLSQRDPDTRKIFTSTNGTNKIQFNLGKVSALHPLLGTSTTTESSNLITWVRGENVNGLRNRQGWLLGDIVASSPVVVGAPSHFYDFLDYNAFRTQWQDRDEVVYIGANDGMLHAFRATNGDEWWAYIPNNQIDRLKDLSDINYCHRYYVNLSPKAVDVHIGGAWKTVLLIGQEQGGAGYTALDVTDPRPAGMQVLWDVDLPIMKESWSVPEVIRDKASDKFLALVGSGPDRVNQEAYMIALDMEDGSIVWQSNNLSTTSDLNMVTAAQKIDLDFDGYDDYAYFGDLAGNFWRLDLTASPWALDKLFQTNQPIQAKPILGIDHSYNIVAYFGTGRYIEDSDVDDTSTQTFYCIIDNSSTGTVTRSDMVDQTYSITPLTVNDRGWYIDLVQGAGERITRPDALAAGTVYFTTFQPSSQTCSAGGRSWLYAVDFDDGSNSDNDDGSENNNTDDRVSDLGDGIYSEPILDLANEDIILQSTDTSLRVEDTKGNIQRIVVRSWRQLYN